MTSYILDDDNRVVAIEDILVWAEWWEEARRQNRNVVAQTQIRDGAWVSTVFIGLDMGFNELRPIVFETMAFTARSEVRWSELRQAEVDGVGEELDTARYATWNEAVMGHERMVEKWAAARLDS